MSYTQWAIVARLVRPQGRHGEIAADLLTDFPERFADRKRLYLVASETSEKHVREMALERHWLHKGRVVLKFAGIDSISDAESLRNLLVAIPASERALLADDAVYISDLIGCKLVDVASEPISVGEVTDVDREAGLLIIQPARGEEFLIPFAREYLVDIDIPGKQMKMRLPVGLLDINAPITEEERHSLDNAANDE